MLFFIPCPVQINENIDQCGNDIKMSILTRQSSENRYDIDSQRLSSGAQLYGGINHLDLRNL
jgi:hypothetical protein